MFGEDGLDDVPMGPYLRSLESLEVNGYCLMARLPAWLAAATQLRTLRLICYNIQLDAADAALLSALPSLRSLDLPKIKDMSQQEWDYNVAQLQAMVIAQGREPLLMTG